MPRKRESKKPFIISFSVVLVALAAVTLGIPYLSGPPVYHFPASYNVTIEPWMNLVPPNAVAAGVINLDQVVDTGLNYSQVVATFVNIYQVGIALTPENISMIATYSLPAPTTAGNNTEVDIFYPTATAYSSVLNELTSSSLVIKEDYKSVTIYRIENNNTLLKTLTLGYLFFYNGSIIYIQSNQGATDALTSIQNAVDFTLTGGPSLFANKTVQAALYASTGGGSDFLALYYVSFGTQLQNFTMGSKIVYYSDGNFDGKYAFGFQDISVSKARYNEVTKLYPDGSSYFVLDNYVIANFVFDPGGVDNEIQGF